MSFPKCGGCNLRHMNYKYTLDLKRKIVQDLVNKNLNTKIIVEEVLGMEEPYYYRNKASFPIGINEQGEIDFGVFAPRSHRIISNNNCLIQSKISIKIAREIINFIKEKKLTIYNEETLKGIFRHIVIRNSKDEKDVMVTIVVNEDIDKAIKKELVENLVLKFDNIKTIIENINNKKTNVILGEKEEVLYGEGYIIDCINDYKFKISSKSFYQVNRNQVETLYNIGIKEANLSKEDVLYDLYSGIGTIGIIASKSVKKVIMIETIKEAVENAKENIKLNNIENIEVICSKVEENIDNIKEKPNIIIVDPPRKGLDLKTIEVIKKIKPEKLVYISCNPATLVRDLNKLEEIYNIIRIKPVDMFPYTKHVECVVALNLR